MFIKTICKQFELLIIIEESNNEINRHFVWYIAYIKILKENLNKIIN